MYGVREMDGGGVKNASPPPPAVVALLLPPKFGAVDEDAPAVPAEPPPRAAGDCGGRMTAEEAVGGLRW